MRNKFWYLTKTSLAKKLKTKWFLVVNIILMIAIIGVVNIDGIISFFGGDFDNKTEIVVIDSTKQVYSTFSNNIKNSKSIMDEDFDVSIKQSDKSKSAETKSLKDKVLVLFSEDKDGVLQASVVTTGKIDTLDYQMIVAALSSTKSTYQLAKSNINASELATITGPITIDRVILDKDKKTGDEAMDTVMGTVFPTVILPFFMLTIILVQMIGAEINEEKTTRSMEVIISNVSPKTHFFAKITASNLFVIVQGLLLVSFAVIGLLVRQGFGDSKMVSMVTESLGPIWNTLVESGFAAKLVYIIPLTLVLMLLSFIAYSLVAGILASMTVNMEDYQQIQTPIIMLSLVSYYLAIMASMFDGSLFIRVLSYVPFISCLLSPALLVLGQIGIVDVCISIVLLILFNFIGIRYGLRIYKIGILNYSNEKIWTRFKKIVRAKNA